MTVCSRTIAIAFPIVFYLIIPKQGIEMQFFPEQVVEILKKWAPPRHVTFKCPAPVDIILPLLK